MDLLVRADDHQQLGLWSLKGNRKIQSDLHDAFQSRPLGKVPVLTHVQARRHTKWAETPATDPKVAFVFEIL